MYETSFIVAYYRTEFLFHPSVWLPGGRFGAEYEGEERTPSQVTSQLIVEKAQTSPSLTLGFGQQALEIQ